MNSFLPLRKAYVRCAATAVLLRLYWTVRTEWLADSASSRETSRTRFSGTTIRAARARCPN